MQNSTTPQSSDEVYSEEPELRERRLIAAIIVRALRDYLTPEDKVHDVDRKDARNWFFCRFKDAPRKWSFQWCCRVLGLHAGKLRFAIKTKGDEIRELLMRDEDNSVFYLSQYGSMIKHRLKRIPKDERTRKNRR